MLFRMDNKTPPPVAIGGIGGSGTRLCAMLLHAWGYYLGDDLNQAMDNLWFTLLFKRRSVLFDPEPTFQRLVSLFCRRMEESLSLSNEDLTCLIQLAGAGRLQDGQDWLLQRASSFAGDQSSKKPGQPWGWKEPNTHVVIDRILPLRPELKYIHVVRHPLEMAVSKNQNQLENWGPIFLDREIVIGPKDSLRYWCMAHRRMLEIRGSWPDRIMLVQVEQLCADPRSYGQKIANFLGTSLDDAVIARFFGFLNRAASFGRYQAVDVRQFDAADLHYVADLGYDLPC